MQTYGSQAFFACEALGLGPRQKRLCLFFLKLEQTAPLFSERVPGVPYSYIRTGVHPYIFLFYVINIKRKRGRRGVAGDP